MVSGVPDASAGDNRSPHSLQNFADGKFGVPQRAHTRLKAVPHSTQNLGFAGFSALQFAHRIVATSRIESCMRTHETAH
jgi:hypothetical protein